MLRIDVQAGRRDAAPVLRLEGQVVGEWVSELRRVYARVSGSEDKPYADIVIDLKDVTFIDRAGVAFFDEIFPNVVLINCSLFAAEQLKPVTQRHAAVTQP